MIDFCTPGHIYYCMAQNFGRWQAARDLLEIFLSNFPPILNSEKESTEHRMDEVIRLYHKNIIHKTV